MLKTCLVSGKQFSLSDADIAFYERVSPVIKGKKYLIPVPTLSPEERLRRRWSFRNEHALFNGTCAKTGKAIVMMYPPTAPLTVYDQQLWWDKSWDGTEYGRDFDFSRSFFEQFKELLFAVPHPNLLNDAASNVNSDFVNCTIGLKNCYMISDAGSNEDCYYSNIINGCKNCVDCSAVMNCELGYQLVGSMGCYNSKFLIDSENCRDSAFLYGCKFCSDCFGCYNLRHRQYCWKNEQLTKEEYAGRLAQLDLGNFAVYEQCKAEFLEAIKKAPREYAFLTQCENVSGNVLANCHDNHSAFDCDANQNSSFTISTKNVRDSYDIEHTYNAELSLEVMAATNIYQNFFCCYTINSQYLFYSYLVSASKNCFGCVGLKNQEYCILNKKYSQEEYEALVPKIIDHMQKDQQWGEFFPMIISLQGYNDSLAADYFPLSKDQALAMGAAWDDYEAPKPPAMDTIAAQQLPLSIAAVDENILQRVLVCSVSGKLFRITKQELQFYRQQSIPLPRVCQQVRYQERLKLRLPRRLVTRQCDCVDSTHEHGERCDHQFQTPYELTRPEQVYCERCYQQIVT